jgi:hypothetical protein
MFYNLYRYALSAFAFHAVIDTIPNVMHAPKTTEGTVPNILAASPDSNAPISLDEPINMVFTAETLPRI